MNNNKDLISIIIVNFNTTKLTINSIKSVYSIKPKVNFEIIVVDNASESDSFKKIENSFKNKKNIKFIRNKNNLGFSKANNIGIKKAKGNYIFLLNSDTVLKKDSLDKLYNFATKTKNLGAVVPKLLNRDGSAQPSVFKFPTIHRAVMQYWLGESKVLDKYVPSGNSPVKVEAAVMAAFLITPLGFSKVGKLDERYFMFFEDIEYCRQLDKNNLDLYFLPDAEVIHLHGQSGKKLADSQNQWRRLIPSSKIYHGIINHYIYNFILWSGQKIRSI